MSDCMLDRLMAAPSGGCMMPLTRLPVTANTRAARNPVVGGVPGGVWHNSGLSFNIEAIYTLTQILASTRSDFMYRGFISS